MTIKILTYFLTSLISLVLLIHVGSADQSYTVNASKNKTVQVLWTVGDTGAEHVLKCIGDGEPLPTLRWMRDTEDNFTGGDNVIVDISKSTEISITFNKIDYDIMNDYFCVATTIPSSTNGTTSISTTYFKVLVESPRSRGIVFGLVIFLMTFLVGGTFLCRTLQINHFSTKIDL